MYISYFFSILILIGYSISDPCPFNSDCTCHDNAYAGFYWSVLCQTPTLPNLTSPYQAYYTSQLTLIGNVSSIPAGAFSTFQWINRLVLQQTVGPAEANWHPESFWPVRVADLVIVGLDPFAVIRNGLRVNDMLSLNVSNVNTAVHLETHAFANLTDLQDLAIENTPISKIDRDAFSGLEKTLESLTLVSASLSEVPKAIRILGNLKKLDFSKNNISTFEETDFVTLTDLKSLTLSGNILQPTVDAGSLKFPPSLVKLYTTNAGLKAVPNEALETCPNLQYLYMNENMITKIDQADFRAVPNVGVLDLSGNPITRVDIVFKSNVPGLLMLFMQNIQVDTLDLAAFGGIFETDLSNSINLKSIWANVTVWGQEHVRPQQTVFIRNTSLAMIDSSIDGILDHDHSYYLIMDISDNHHLICNADIAFLAKYSLCGSYKIRADKTRCGNMDKALVDYLKETVPNPCQATLS